LVQVPIRQMAGLEYQIHAKRLGQANADARHQVRSDCCSLAGASSSKAERPKLEGTSTRDSGLGTSNAAVVDQQSQRNYVLSRLGYLSNQSIIRNAPSNITLSKLGTIVTCTPALARPEPRRPIASNAYTRVLNPQLLPPPAHQHQQDCKSIARRLFGFNLELPLILCWSEYSSTLDFSLPNPS
jgi:hypothetical protein